LPVYVDFNSKYIKPRLDPTAAPPMPVIELVLVNQKRHFGAFGLLDTGSVYTLISPEYARLLRIDLAGLPATKVIGLGRAVSMAYETDIKMVLRASNYAWMATVAISDAVVGFPFQVLLGHKGFFDRFDVTFQTRHQHFHLKTERAPL
jgi:hypothetical protein